MVRFASFLGRLRVAVPVLPLAFALCAAPAQAIVLYGVGAGGNTSDPGNGAPWDAVGSTGNGSCVYLGNGYAITANHVSLGATASFAGGTFSRDAAFAPVQIAPGVDAKVFRLSAVPVGWQGVTLYGGTGELGAAVTQVGWGEGRNPADTDFGPNPLPITVSWGGVRAQRWGVNAVSGVFSDVNVSGYVYDALETALDSTNGIHEAGIANGDSGSAMFSFLGGQWQLVGLNTAATTGGSSTFGGLTPDANVAVRISSYRDQILVLVPEPASAGLLVLGGTWLLLRRPRRRWGLRRNG